MWHAILHMACKDVEEFPFKKEKEGVHTTFCERSTDRDEQEENNMSPKNYDSLS